MFFLKRIVVADYERALLIKNRSVQRVLEPGVYRFFDPLRRLKVEIYDLNEAEFNFEKLDYLIKQKTDLVNEHFQVIELGEFEVGLVYKNGQLEDVLEPGSRQLYWKGLVDIDVEVVDIQTDFMVAKNKLKVLVRNRNTKLANKLSQFIYIAEVEQNWVGLLLVDGELVEQLNAGIYAFWKFNRNIKVEQEDLRVQNMEVNGQEILTKDKVTLRANMAVTFKVTDAIQARSSVKNWVDHLYREAQFGLRQAVGTRSLDTLLANKGELDRGVYDAVRNQVADNGIEVINVGIKDLILPGEMKDILNQVVEAEKVAQANVIKRREETAATRSLLNTAKLMDENPTLLRLKELETLEKVTEKVDRLTVFGGLDGVLQDTVKINV